MNTTLSIAARQSLLAAVLIAMLGMSAFFAFEPNVTRSQEVFLVSQTITDEVSFSTIPPDVSMTGSIAGLAGGYATGSTQFVINTNDAQGYTMTLVFSSTTAMSRNNGTGGFINNYTPATPGTPDFNWVDNSAGQSAEFGYTVAASTTGQVDQSFRHTGSTCNTGSTETALRCWLNPSTTPETIIVTNSPTPSSTSTLTFKVAVPNGPNPALPSGIYIATGTLTATTNP
jgi:hypothetical protein